MSNNKKKKSKLSKLNMNELMSLFSEYSIRQIKAESSRDANRLAKEIGEISNEIISRGEPAIAEQMRFIESAPPEVQIWAVVGLKDFHPQKIKQILHNLTEHTGVVSVNAKLFLRDMK